MTFRLLRPVLFFMLEIENIRDFYRSPDFKLANSSQKEKEVIGLMAQLYGECGKYMDQEGMDKINIAMGLMNYGHQNHSRDNSDPYTTHLLKVALPLVQKYQMDWETIAAALDHDLLEDSEKNGFPVTIEDLINLLSPTVASTVNTLSKARFGDTRRDEYVDAIARAEIFSSLIDNPRAAVIKIFDRLHNLQTIEFVQDEKSREQKAYESLRYYVPLAQLLNLYEEADELARLSLKVINPVLTEQLINIQANYKHLVEIPDEETGMSYSNVVRQRVAAVLGIDEADIHLYLADIYSIYRNMNHSNEPNLEHCFLRVDIETKSTAKWYIDALSFRDRMAMEYDRDYFLNIESVNLNDVKEKAKNGRLNSLDFFLGSKFGLGSNLKFNIYPSGGIMIAQTPITDLYYRQVEDPITAVESGVSENDILKKHAQGRKIWDQIRQNIGMDIGGMEKTVLGRKFFQTTIPGTIEIFEKGIENKDRSWYLDSGSTILDYVIDRNYDPKEGNIDFLLNVGPFMVNGQEVSADYVLKPHDRVTIDSSSDISIQPRWIRMMQTSAENIKQLARDYFRGRLNEPGVQEMLEEEAIYQLGLRMKQNLVVNVEQADTARNFNLGTELMNKIALVEIGDEVIKKIASELVEYQKKNVLVIKLSFNQDAPRLGAMVLDRIGEKGINIARQTGQSPRMEGGHPDFIFHIDLDNEYNKKSGRENVEHWIEDILIELNKNPNLAHAQVGMMGSVKEAI